MTDYLKKYPWLRTQNLYTGKVEDDYCALNDIPKGWVLAFGKMFCEEMDVVLKDLGISDKFFVAQMKEKFGSLRFYPSVRDEKIRKVIKKYEALSSHICIHCGKPDVHIISAGWYGPMCEECYQNKSHISKSYTYDSVIDKDRTHMMSGPIESIMNPTEYELNICETANKIRKSWEENKKNRRTI
jgi:hypothetical protein